MLEERDVMRRVGPEEAERGLDHRPLPPLLPLLLPLRYSMLTRRRPHRPNTTPEAATEASEEVAVEEDDDVLVRRRGHDRA